MSLQLRYTSNAGRKCHRGKNAMAPMEIPATDMDNDDWNDDDKETDDDSSNAHHNGSVCNTTTTSTTT